jgi:sec-independent protein translocase protein TatA
MGSFSWAHWLIVGIIVLVLFGGRGKVSDIMGDFAKGIKAFKKGLNDDDAEAARDGQKTIADQPVAPSGVKTEAQSKAG